MKCNINPLIDALIAAGQDLDSALKMFQEWKDVPEFFQTEEQTQQVGYTTSPECFVDVINGSPIYEIPYGMEIEVEGANVPEDTFVIRDSSWGYITHQAKIIRFSSESGMRIDAILKGGVVSYRSFCSITKQDIVVDSFNKAFLHTHCSSNMTHKTNLKGDYYDSDRNLTVSFQPMVTKINDFDVTVFTVSYFYGIIGPNDDFEQHNEWSENPFDFVGRDFFM